MKITGLENLRAAADREAELSGDDGERALSLCTTPQTYRHALITLAKEKGINLLIEEPVR